MAYLANIVTVAEMQLYAGANVGTADADANHTILQDQAEAYLSNLLKYNLDAAGWGALVSPNKEMISEWAARFAANGMIVNDMSGYATDEASARIHGEDLINVNFSRMQQIEKLLAEGGVQPFMGI